MINQSSSITSPSYISTQEGYLLFLLPIHLIVSAQDIEEILCEDCARVLLFFSIFQLHFFLKVLIIFHRVIRVFHLCFVLGLCA